MVQPRPNPSWNFILPVILGTGKGRNDEPTPGGIRPTPQRPPRPTPGGNRPPVPSTDPAATPRPGSDPPPLPPTPTVPA